jgi:SAM-dependent methyltransferase
MANSEGAEGIVAASRPGWERLPGHLYDYPVYYDLVYGSDWKAEFDFLTACFRLHAEKLFSTQRLNRGAVRLFEPACGTGRILHRFAKAGYRVSGLDLSKPSIDFCNSRLRRVAKVRDEKVEEVGETWVGDMTDFELPEPVDAAFNTINSFRHLLTEKLAAKHLACIAEALRPGGLYVLGLHLTPTSGPAIEHESWSARRGNVAVNTTMQTIERDLSARRERCAMILRIYTPTRWLELDDEMVFRTYTAAQLRRLLAGEPRLELAALYDFSYRIDEPIEIEPETEDIVLVLRKRGDDSRQ